MWNHSLEQVNELLWQSPCVQEGNTIFLVVLIALVCTQCEEYMANGKPGQVHYWVQGKCMVTSMRRHRSWNFGFATDRTLMTGSRESSNGNWELWNGSHLRVSRLGRYHVGCGINPRRMEIVLQMQYEDMTPERFTCFRLLKCQCSCKLAVQEEACWWTN
jgi:hypothetical protein